MQLAQTQTWRRAARWVSALACLALAGPALAAQVDLVVNNTVAKAVYSYADVTAHTVNIENRGPAGATNAVLTFTNPPSANTPVAWNTQVTCTASGGAVCPSSYALDATKTTLTATVPSVPVGGQLALSIPAPIYLDLSCGMGCFPSPISASAYTIKPFVTAVSTASVAAGAGDTDLIPATNSATASYGINNPTIDYSVALSNIGSPQQISSAGDTRRTFQATVTNLSSVVNSVNLGFGVSLDQGTGTLSTTSPYFAAVPPAQQAVVFEAINCVGSTGGASCASATQNGNGAVTIIGMPPQSTVTFTVSMVLGAPLCTDSTKGGQVGDYRSSTLTASVGSDLNNSAGTNGTGLMPNTGNWANHYANAPAVQIAAPLCKRGDLLVQSIVNAGATTYGPNKPFAVTVTYANGLSSPDGAAQVPLKFQASWPTAGMVLADTPSSCVASNGAECPTSWTKDGLTMTGVAPVMPPNSSIVVTYTGTTGADDTQVCRPSSLASYADIIPPSSYSDTDYDPNAYPPYRYGTPTKGNNAYALGLQADIGVSCGPSFDLQTQKSGPFSDNAATVPVTVVKPGDWIYFRSKVTLLTDSSPLITYQIVDSLGYIPPGYTSTRGDLAYADGSYPRLYVTNGTAQNPIGLAEKPGDPPSLMSLQSVSNPSRPSGVRCAASNGAVCPTYINFFVTSAQRNYNVSQWEAYSQFSYVGQAPQWPQGGELEFIYSYRVPPLVDGVTCRPGGPNPLTGQNRTSAIGTPTPMGFERSPDNNAAQVQFKLDQLPGCSDAKVQLTKTSNPTYMPSDGKVRYTVVLSNPSTVAIDVPQLQDVLTPGIDQGIPVSYVGCTPASNAICPAYTPQQGVRHGPDGTNLGPTTIGAGMTARYDFDFAWGSPGSATLPPGSSVSFVFDVQYPPNLAIADNKATVHPDASAKVGFPVVSATKQMGNSSGPTPLLVNKDVVPKQAVPGATVTYTVDLINPSATDQLTGLTFTDAMDASLKTSNPAGYGGLTCRPLTAADNQLSGTVGAATCPTFTSDASGITGKVDLPANSGLRLVYTAIAPPAGAVSVPNVAALRYHPLARSSEDGASQANFGMPVPSPDLTSKIAPIPNAGSRVAGQPVPVSVTYDNIGQAAAVNAVPTLQLAPGLTGVSASNGGVYNSATGLITWPVIPSFAVGAPVTYTVSFIMPSATVSMRSDISSDNELQATLANNPDTAAVASPAPIPTLDAWALMALTMLMLGALARRQRRP